MNVKNNKRRQQTRERIEKIFVELLQTRELNQISVSDICKLADINRSTFYANYDDIYALADAIRNKLEQEVNELFEYDITNIYSSGNSIRLFQHIRDNPLFYMTYFKLGYDQTHQINLAELHMKKDVFPIETLHYHVAFYKAGFNALLKLWLQNGCRESPEEIDEILKSEYRGRM